MPMGARIARAQPYQTPRNTLGTNAQAIAAGTWPLTIRKTSAGNHSAHAAAVSTTHAPLHHLASDKPAGIAREVGRMNMHAPQPRRPHHRELQAMPLGQAQPF